VYKKQKDCYLELHLMVQKNFYKTENMNVLAFDNTSLMLAI